MDHALKHIDAAALTRFEVDPDGSRVHFHVLDQEGTAAELVLPATCLGQLLMTLPRVMRDALRNSSGDRSLRVVYPLEGYKIERAQPSGAGEHLFIVTLGSGGFAVSFASSGEALTDIARSIIGDVAASPETEHRPTRLS